ncbi:SdrD B-like domain-containing protein [Roseiconus nitratireducens]|nr:SdrD B-like domain-containing protein [Roseiconus nitratireducens]
MIRIRFGRLIRIVSGFVRCGQRLGVSGTRRCQRVIWKPKRTRRTPRAVTADIKRRSLGPQILERRELLAADPIHVGVVYLETDYLETDNDVGSDSQGDRFLLSFTGGAENTELNQLRIRTDKDGDGISVGDPIFDTQAGGRGKSGWHDFKVVRIETSDGRQATATASVSDGGQELVLDLQNFRAGDRLEFTLDVDEVLRNSVDLAIFNDRLDVITSGQEFQDSILEAVFEAPHFESATADAIFLNDYGSPGDEYGLDLPPDEGTDLDSRPNRSAAAIGSTVQTPRPVAISGNVWLDNNLDATRQSGEAGLSGVELALFAKNSNGQYVDTGHRTQTDGNGTYQFPKSLGLMPGEYRVVQTQPDGYYSVAAVPGSVAGQPTGLATSVDVLSSISIPLGDTEAVEMNFAEAAPSSIAGFVYQDDNNNGIRDPGEAPISGVSMRAIPNGTIASQPTVTAVTDANGAYRFDGLVPGIYDIVQVNQPADFVDGLDTAGTVDGIRVGVADNPGDAIRGIQLGGGVVGLNYNFGELAYGQISGNVYLVAPGQDCDGDHDDPGNEPLSGVIVELQAPDGNVISRVTTTPAGTYHFGRVAPGTYQIVQYTPEGLIDGGSHVGRIDGVQVGDSIDGTTITQITMIPGGVGVEYDFCELAPAKISGYVYHDASNDGRRDTGEQGIPAVTVSLVDSSGNTVATTKTNSLGRYEFEGIPPGTYELRQVQPGDYLDGIDSAGRVDGQRVGVAFNDLISQIALPQGTVGVEYNFGELMPASLSGSVHVDTDGDCVRDDDEVGLGDVVMRLLDADGKEVARTTTSPDGLYRFNHLTPGRYSVVQVQPQDYFDGGVSAGSAGGQVGVNRISQIELGSGIDGVDYDFCEEPPSSLSGIVFVDLDDDCELDEAEQGIAGVRIELRDADGQRVATTTTDAEGKYRFEGLRRGEYTVVEFQPDGYFDGSAIPGSEGGTIGVNRISKIQLAAGIDAVDYDFCEQPPSSLSGTVYIDLDDDCYQDPDEDGIAGVTIELRDSDGNRVATTVTDANGNYRFEGLRSGTYTVVELQPDGFFDGHAQAGSVGGTVGANRIRDIDLAAGVAATDYDFCELPPASLSGSVYVDSDQDCVRDVGERGLAGVTIELRDADGNRIRTTTTDASGRYRFEGLAAGDYMVFEVQPDGYYQGGQKLGSAGGAIVGVDLMSVSLNPGVDAVDYLFCEYEPGSISGFVWADVNEDQDRDPDEGGIAGVSVELIDGQGNRIDITTTDGQGSYAFDQLPPGVYSVRELQPSGYFHGGQQIGNQGGVIAGPDWIEGIEILSGTVAEHYNFFEIPPSVISGFVFIDGPPIETETEIAAEQLRQYKDGVLTSDDTRLANIQIEIRDAVGQPLSDDAFLGGNALANSVVMSDAEGFYRIGGLRPGTYTLFQSQPDGLTDSLDTPGTTGGLAVNLADLYTDAQLAMIDAVVGDHGPDAILAISVGAANHSQHNNFSEVQIVIVDPPPPSDFLPGQEPVDERLPPPPPESFAAKQIPFSADVPSDRLPPKIYGDVAEVTWHLSVINAGYPRGSVIAEGVIRHVAAQIGKRDFSEGRHDQGRWQLLTLEGEVHQESQKMTLGHEDGVALVGDFDGDGDDEVAIFVAGEWFVDLNGNGVWDEGDLWIRLGTERDRPVVGDWDGDGKDDIGIYGRSWERDPQRIRFDAGLPDPANRTRRFLESNKRMGLVSMRLRGKAQERLLRRGDGQLRADAVDHVFQFGEDVDTPISGDWNGDGIDQIGTFRGGNWVLDTEGDGRKKKGEVMFEFGRPGDQPIVGDFNGDGIDEVGVIRGGQWIIDSDGDRRLTAADQRFDLPADAPESQPIVGDWDGDGRDEPGYYHRAP